VLRRLRSASSLSSQGRATAPEKWNELEESAAHRDPPPASRKEPAAEGIAALGRDDADDAPAPEEDAMLLASAENSAALRLCRYANSDIDSVLNMHGGAAGAQDLDALDAPFGSGPSGFASAKRGLASLLTVSDERIRRNLLEVLELRGLLSQARNDVATHWGALQALECERACVAAQAAQLRRHSDHLTSLLYRPGAGGDGAGEADVMHPRSMVALGICLRDGAPSHEVLGPIVRAVHAGTSASRTLTHGHQALCVLDEIIEVQGRDVRGLGAAAVMRLLTDAPGTRSELKVKRGSEVLHLDIKRPGQPQPHLRDASAASRSNAHQAMESLQAQQALSDLSLSFANAAGQVRGSETRGVCARAEAEARDQEVHRLRLANHKLLSRLKALEAAPLLTASSLTAPEI
jgi:hypothetical protein